MISDAEAAALALHVVYAFDMHEAAPTSITPPLDRRLAPRWRLMGYLTAGDAILPHGAQSQVGSPVCYGYLVQDVEHPNIFVAAIRGTFDMVEWVKDAEFAPRKHPVAGYVEEGFWSIYSTMEYRPTDGFRQEASQGLAAAVGNGELIVLGHSLGAPLATYLTFDLAARMGPRVQAYFFASPRPGDGAFAKAFDAAVATYHVWNYSLDIVPRVPISLDYCELPKVTWIHAGQARIDFELFCHHHLLCYCALLDYDLLDWSKVPDCDKVNAVCIRGRSTPG